MKAPMSDRVRRILADPKAARDFMRQLITSREQGDDAIISVKLEGDRKPYAFGRVARRSNRHNG